MEQEQKLTEYEKGLVERLKIVTEKKQAAELALEAISKEFNDVEFEIRSFLQDDGDRKKTGEYNGLGWVTVVEQRLSASIEEGFQQDVMDYVKEIGREDLIKTSINSMTLSSFVGQLLKDNQPLPPHVTFFRPKKARFYPAKG